MGTTTNRLSMAAQGTRAEEHANAAGLLGLVARGILYLVLAGLAVELAVSDGGEQVDSRGALHDLAQNGAGKVALVLLVVGFAAFALWHAYVALVGGSAGKEVGQRVADAVRAVVYGSLCALSASFLFASKSSGNSDQAGKTWTARLLDWSGGQLLVGAIGVAVIAAGLYLLWRAVSGRPQDEKAVLEAAPRETDAVHWLGAIGNAARGVVVGLVGLFLLVAAVQYDPNETVGLDGALKRLLDESYGAVLVLLVAAGLASFGIYSIARAWVNRHHV
jgi:Domain of Unknown Function (DUF1206)